MQSGGGGGGGGGNQCCECVCVNEVWRERFVCEVTVCVRGRVLL